MNNRLEGTKVNCNVLLGKVNFCYPQMPARTTVVEKRKRVRTKVAVNELVYIKALKVPVYLIDVSEGGIAIQTMDPLKEGGKHDLTLSLPGADFAIKMKASVIYSHPDGRAGLEFKSMSTSDRKRLREWMKARGAAS